MTLSIDSFLYKLGHRERAPQATAAKALPEQAGVILSDFRALDKGLGWILESMLPSLLKPRNRATAGSQILKLQSGHCCVGCLTNKQNRHERLSLSVAEAFTFSSFPPSFEVGSHPTLAVDINHWLRPNLYQSSPLSHSLSFVSWLIPASEQLRDIKILGARLSSWAVSCLCLGKTIIACFK